MAKSPEIKQEAIRLKSEGLILKDIQSVIMDKFGEHVSTGSIHGWTKGDYLGDLGDDLEDSTPYEVDEAKQVLFVYTGKVNKFGEKEKVRHEIPFDFLQEVWERYVRIGGWNRSQTKILNYYGIKPKVWRKIKSALMLDKDQGLLPRILLDIIADNEGEEAVEKIIEESAFKSVDRYRKIEQDKVDRVKQKRLEKALGIVEARVDWLDEFGKYLDSHKPRDIKLPKINKVKNERWKLFGAGDFHFGVHTAITTKNLSVMTNYIAQLDIDTAYIILGGDFFENLVAEGMHNGQVQSQDMYGFDLIMYVVEQFETMLLTIRNTGKKVIVYGLKGNHDRIAKNHGDDVERVGAEVTYELIARGLKDTDIEINVLGQDFNPLDIEGVRVVTHHGDKNASSKAQKKPEDILWKHGKRKVFNAIVYFDKHNRRMNETLNADAIGVSAMTPQGEYAKKLDLHSRAGFMEYELIHGLPTHRMIRV